MQSGIGKGNCMRDGANKKPVLVIPCSGIGKVHGLLTREATYLVTDELAPELTETMCLGLLVKGEAEAVEAVNTQPCITIDGCPKMCAEKNVKVAGGNPVAVEVVETLKKHPGAKPGSPTDLNDEGWIIAREIATKVADTAANMRRGREEAQ
jgi:uncharacterized metal-binding protein